MRTEIFDISVTHEGKIYKGWVHPSDKPNENGLPKSYHVVLDDVFFGNLSDNSGQWAADEQRPQALVEEVGKVIEATYKK